MTAPSPRPTNYFDVVPEMRDPVETRDRAVKEVTVSHWKSLLLSLAMQALLVYSIWVSVTIGQTVGILLTAFTCVVMWLLLCLKWYQFKTWKQNLSERSLHVEGESFSTWRAWYDDSPHKISSGESPADAVQRLLAAESDALTRKRLSQLLGWVHRQ